MRKIIKTTLFVFVLLLCKTTYPSVAIADEDIDHLVKIQTQNQNVYQSINNFNPFSPDYQKQKLDRQAPQSAATSILLKFMTHPYIQPFLRFFASPTLTQAVAQILYSPKKMYILYSEIGLFIALFIFRAWNISRLSQTSWIRVLWLRLWTLACYIIIAAVVIPWGFLGDPYYKIVNVAFHYTVDKK